MSKAMKHVGNALGDLRAEYDHVMLDAAFYETPDYKTLIESSDKTVVVGRRGAGKSALAYQLSKYWQGVPNTRVTMVVLETEQVIGLEPVFEHLGHNYRLIAAASKLAWRYAFLMEMCLDLSAHFKFDRADDSGTVRRHLIDWRKLGESAAVRIRRLLESHLGGDRRSETQIAELSTRLRLHDAESAVSKTLEELGLRCVLLVDKLDEGYQPSDVGVGFVDGIVEAAIEINTRHKLIQPTLFLRDNMFRTLARRNPDYSRNIEAQVLHIHWDEYQLKNLVCNRLREAFNIKLESNVKVWDRFTDGQLKGSDGFRKCLQLTLYRPRDILHLLNRA